MENPEKEHARVVLVELSRNFRDHLILAGIVDEKAKLMDYQKGEVTSFQVTGVRQNKLGINASLVFALAKQLEEFAGPLAHSVLTYDDYEVVIMGISPGSILYAICTAGASSDIVEALPRLVEAAPLKESQKWMVAGSDQDFVSSEWSGR